MRFREKLEREFKTRCERNPRYSLRAFAAFPGTDHSALSQVLASTRPIPVRRLRVWAGKLGMTREETAVYIAAGNVPEAQASEREAHLRHWTAEALGILAGPAHWEILRLHDPQGISFAVWRAKRQGAD